MIEAALEIANGGEVDANLQTIFGQLPAVMARADDRAAQIDRAVLDLAEAIMLQGCEGKRFDAVVTDIDERGARIQLSDPAVIGRIDAKDTMPGDQIQVRTSTCRC